MNKTNKLSNKTIFGYAFGSLADAASYNFIVMYMLYFLTAIIGLSAVRQESSFLFLPLHQQYTDYVLVL